MEEKVIKIIADITETSVSKVEASADDTDVWDSLKRAEIIFALEDEFGIFFEPEEIERIVSVNNAVEIIKNKI